MDFRAAAQTCPRAGQPLQPRLHPPPRRHATAPCACTAGLLPFQQAPRSGGAWDSMEAFTAGLCCDLNPAQEL